MTGNQTGQFQRSFQGPRGLPLQGTGSSVLPRRRRRALIDIDAIDRERQRSNDELRIKQLEEEQLAAMAAGADPEPSSKPAEPQELPDAPAETPPADDQPGETTPESPQPIETPAAEPAEAGPAPEAVAANVEQSPATPADEQAPKRAPKRTRQIKLT